jgi:hypothetical protein
MTAALPSAAISNRPGKSEKKSAQRQGPGPKAASSPAGPDFPHLPKAPAVRSSFQAGFFFCVQDFPLVFVLDRKDLFPDTFSNSWKRRQ